MESKGDTLKRDDILSRLGELAGEIEKARTDPGDIAALSALTQERDDLRDILRSHAPLSVEDMQRELDGLKSHLARFPGQGLELAIAGEGSVSGTRNSVNAIADEQSSADPHSAVVWIRQRIAFLEDQIRKG
ncbi:MAG: hypothetical protein OEY55_04985 [Acidimicrobiia bacterium]|nr:hypothetical protein [Acidimicrobiia bacterium]MDH5421137.1 hypothetical protein [Acidimicrobiia bacterium]MDH5503515.1 hypothetical protein [Acidimicrobiia bacterium]